MDDFNEHKQEARNAFDKATASGRLSRNISAHNYAGNYMYMGKCQGQNTFKNINTREYLAPTEAQRVKLEGRF